MERVLAGSVAASEHEQGVNSGQDRYSESPEAMLKRGGIIGAAALTGGALMAITGGIYFMLQLTRFSFLSNRIVMIHVTLK